MLFELLLLLLFQLEFELLLELELEFQFQFQFELPPPPLEQAWAGVAVMTTKATNAAPTNELAPPRAKPRRDLANFTNLRVICITSQQSSPSLVQKTTLLDQEHGFLKEPRNSRTNLRKPLLHSPVPISPFAAS